VLRALISALFGFGFLLAQDPGLEVLRKQRHWKQLRPRIEGWFKAKPDDPYALLWMSRLKQAFADPEGALELARKSAAARPSDPDIQAQLGFAAGQSAGQADGKLKQLSLAREMKKALEAALPAKIEDVELQNYLLQFYLQAPGLVGGGTGKARDLAQRVAQVQPSAGLVLQANIAFYDKNPDGARVLIQQAIGKDPGGYDVHLAMARYHLSLKPQALDAALGCYRQALATRPDGIVAHAQIAAILAEQGKWAELDAALATARRTNPENLFPYFAAGSNLIAENKHLDRVEPLLRVYLGQPAEGNMPDHAVAHRRLGQLFEKQGRKGDALKEMEQAMRLRPTYPQAQKDIERLRKG